MIFGSEKGGHCPPLDGDSNVAHLPKTLEMWVSSARHECFGDEPAKSAQGRVCGDTCCLHMSQKILRLHFTSVLGVVLFLPFDVAQL